jgi:hypothetical protein
MARENSLWGAPRIHGELLMLGFTVSQATVSRYLPAPGRRPTQSWRTFLRNQASAFGQYSEERSGGYARLHVPSHWAKLKRSTAAQIATVCIGFWRGLRRPQPALNAGRISLVSAQRDRGVTYGARRVASVPGGSGRALDNRSGTAVAIRSPPHQAWALPCLRPWATQDAALAQSRARFHHAGR